MNLKRIKERLGMNQKSFGKVLGMSHPRFAKFESGEYDVNDIKEEVHQYLHSIGREDLIEGHYKIDNNSVKKDEIMLCLVKAQIAHENLGNAIECLKEMM